jgi:hypothetical protein
LLSAQVGLDYNPPIYASHCSWDDRRDHQVQLFPPRWGLLNFFAQAGLEP